MINDFGELGVEFENITGPGALVTKDFLGKLMENFVERSSKYYEKVNEHAFAYRERQLQSIICPAIADITNSYLIENPLIRKPAGEDEYRGAADYWVLYREFSFLLELKHNYFAFNSSRKPRKSIEKKFSQAIEQLRNIRTDECRSQTIGKGMRRIALEAVIFYQSSKEKDKLQIDIANFEFWDSLEKLLLNSGIEKDCNLRALWVLDEKLIERFEYSNG